MPNGHRSTRIPPPGATKPKSDTFVELATTGLWINNLLSEHQSTHKPQHFKSTCVVFLGRQSQACAQQMFSRITLYEQVRCERHCANVPFVQTCNRRYFCDASQSVSPLRKKTRIQSANIKSTATTMWRNANCILSLGRTTEHHVCGSILIRSDGKPHNTCGSRQHTHGTRNRSTVWRQNWTHFLRCCMQHHINCQTQTFSASPLNQHLSMLAKIRGNTRNGYIPGEVDATGQNALKKP